MCSAIERLPHSMTVEMNLVTRRRTSGVSSVYRGSVSMIRFGTSPLRGMLSVRSLGLGGLEWLLGALGAVLGAALAAIVDAGGVEGAANDVVANAGEVLHTAAADEHHGVLLQVVPFTRNVGGHFHPVGEAHAGH